MSENTSKENVSNDEIDLVDLFRRMGKTITRWTNAVGRAIIISIVFLIRKWLPLGLSLILGACVSLFLKTTAESFFTSDIILRSNAVPSADLIDYINKLHTFCSENNTPVLSDALSIPQESLDNVLDISAFWVIDKSNDEIPDYVDYRNNHNVYDTINVRMNDRLDIRTIVKSPQELSLLRDGLIKFIEKDTLLQLLNRLRLKQNKELITRMDYDILQLDSLQKVKYFEETRSRQPQQGGQMIFLQEQNTQLVYSDIYTLYSKKQALESQQDIYYEIVTVLSDFSIPAKRDNGVLYYGKKVVPLFFFITLLLLILISNRKRLIEVFRKY